MKSLLAAKFPALVLLAACLSSCASVSVLKTERLGDRQPKNRPDKILVKPFDFHEPAIRADRKGKALEAFQQQVSNHLANALAKNLSAKVAPAEVVAEDATLPRGNYWLIDGRITRLHQGSRLLRSVVGLGFGGTKLEATAWVQNLREKPPQKFLLIETTGGSNISPGVLGTAVFFINGVTSLLSLVNLVEGVRSGVSFDASRTAKEITAASSEFLYQQRAIPHEEAIAPKRPGRWSPDVWPFRRAPERLPEGRITVEPAG